jgi:4-hydroxybenzoyl-CoA reductase subunit beta
MMRLPRFQYLAARSVREAAERLAAAPGDAMLVGGGTDLVPNMKRRQQCPATLIGLRGIDDLKRVSNGDGMTIGAGVTHARLLRVPRLRDLHRGLWQAAAQIATPQLRNMGTLGGNLCLDTRCNYYDQNYEWRKAIDFCMKKDGKICWVAPSSSTCLAVSSTDLAPMLVALDASVTLVAADHERRIGVADLYRHDGIHYLTRTPMEILTAVHVPAGGWRSAYWKLRRRGAFDFPVLSAAAAVTFAADGSVADARLVLGAIASAPLVIAGVADTLRGNELNDTMIAAAAELASGRARPMDNTDFSLHWRKRLVREFVTYALREIRGDDVRDLRRKVSRMML